MEILLVAALAAFAVWVVSGPLRRGAADRALSTQALRRAELEAARDSKYSEIRDAELDHRTGKLSDSDWRAIDRTLRAEAMEILRALDELGEA